MKSEKLSSVPPIITKNEVINDAQRKSDIFNDLFTAKATVEGNDDPVPVLEPLDNILESLEQINTSPIEISKILSTNHKRCPFIPKAGFQHNDLQKEVRRVVVWPNSLEQKVQLSSLWSQRIRTAGTIC